MPSPAETAPLCLVAACNRSLAAAACSQALPAQNCRTLHCADRLSVIAADVRTRLPGRGSGESLPILSDGAQWMTARLASQHEEWIRDQQLMQFAVVQTDEFLVDEDECEKK